MSKPVSRLLEKNEIKTSTELTRSLVPKDVKGNSKSPSPLMPDKVRRNVLTPEKNVLKTCVMQPTNTKSCLTKDIPDCSGGDSSHPVDSVYHMKKENWAQSPEESPKTKPYVTPQRRVNPISPAMVKSGIGTPETNIPAISAINVIPNIPRQQVLLHQHQQIGVPVRKQNRLLHVPFVCVSPPPVFTYQLQSNVMPPNSVTGVSPQFPYVNKTSKKFLTYMPSGRFFHNASPRPFIPNIPSPIPPMIKQDMSNMYPILKDTTTSAPSSSAEAKIFVGSNVLPGAQNSEGIMFPQLNKPQNAHYWSYYTTQLLGPVSIPHHVVPLGRTPHPSIKPNICPEQYPRVQLVPVTVQKIAKKTSSTRGVASPPIGNRNCDSPPGRKLSIPAETVRKNVDGLEQPPLRNVPLWRMKQVLPKINDLKKEPKEENNHVEEDSPPSNPSKSKKSCARQLWSN